MNSRNILNEPPIYAEYLQKNVCFIHIFQVDIYIKF